MGPMCFSLRLERLTSGSCLPSQRWQRFKGNGERLTRDLHTNGHLPGISQSQENGFRLSTGPGLHVVCVCNSCTKTRSQPCRPACTQGIATAWNVLWRRKDALTTARSKPIPDLSRCLTMFPDMVHSGFLYVGNPKEISVDADRKTRLERK
jgi:hypothetical protein